jgi:hypothetical protein
MHNFQVFRKKSDCSFIPQSTPWRLNYWIRKPPRDGAGKRRTMPKNAISFTPLPHIPHRPERLLAVHVAGGSMVEAHICDGDIAIFHPGITEGNGIFVVSIENSLVVKRVDRNSAASPAPNWKYPDSLVRGGVLS